MSHDDVIKWKYFPRYWPFVRGIQRSPVNSPHKGQWRGALMFSSICPRINGWVNNREAGDLRRHRGHYDGSVMLGYCCARKMFPCHNVIKKRTVSFSWKDINNLNLFFYEQNNILTFSINSCEMIENANILMCSLKINPVHRGLIMQSMTLHHKSVTITSS